jgi:hypothetical protein
MQRRDGWKDSGITLSHGARGGAYETPAGNALLRLSVILQSFTLVAALRVKNIVPAGAVVTLTGADQQFGSGSREEKTQAAHKLPRRVLIDGQPLQFWAGKLGADEMFTLHALGVQGATTTLPDYFNKADSLWEGRGLAEAYRAAIAQLVKLSGKGEFFAAKFPEIWSLFLTQSRQALAAAEAGNGAATARGDVLHGYVVALGSKAAIGEAAEFWGRLSMILS